MNEMLQNLIIVGIIAGAIYAPVATLVWFGDREALGPLGHLYETWYYRAQDRALPKEMRGMTIDQMAATYTTKQLGELLNCFSNRKVRQAYDQRKALDVLERDLA